jgi:hypothetical protein
MRVYALADPRADRDAATPRQLVEVERPLPLQHAEMDGVAAGRLAAALVEQRYLTFAPREGYGLGPKLLELGFRAQQAIAISSPIRELIAMRRRPGSLSR